MNTKQKAIVSRIRTLALALNEACVEARALGLDIALAVNEPGGKPLGVQSVHPVINELEEEP